MKLQPVQNIRFIGKSLLWSFGLYILCMTIINWDELSNRTHKTEHTIVQTVPQPGNNPTPDAKPNDPNSNVSAFSHVVDATAIFFSQLLRVVSVFKK